MYFRMNDIGISLRGWNYFLFYNNIKAAFRINHALVTQYMSSALRYHSKEPTVSLPTDLNFLWSASHTPVQVDSSLCIAIASTIKLRRRLIRRNLIRVYVDVSVCVCVCVCLFGWRPVTTDLTILPHAQWYVRPTGGSRCSSLCS